MNSLASRIWIIKDGLNPALTSQGELARFRKAELKIVPNLAALSEELETSERLILLVEEKYFEAALKQYDDRLLAVRPLPAEFDDDVLLILLDAVLQDSLLKQKLDILELNAWTGMRSGKYDEPSIEFLGKTVLEISSCRDLSAAEAVLLEACQRLAQSEEVIIAHDPPFLSSRILGNYQLAVPVNFNTDLKAHVYVRFAPGVDTPAVESVGELILNLSDIIALAVERNRLLTHAQQTKLVWEASFNAVEDPVVILDENFEVVRANKAYGSLAKSPVAKLLGKPVDPAFLSEAQSKTLTDISQEWDSTFEGQYYRLYYDPIPSPSGGGKGVLRLRNVSAERALTEKILAREQVAELGVLVGSVAHEINNPVGGILALGQILLKDVPKHEPLHQDLENIISAAERCKKIVQTMLSLVRKGNDTRSPFHLGDSVRAALELVSTEVQRIGVRVEAKGLDLGDDFVGNRNRIMQVAFHVLQGALQSLEERQAQEKFKARLNIELSQTANHFELTLLDNGLNRTHEHVLKNSVSYAVAQVLLEEHGGQIRLEPEAEWNRQTIVLPTTLEQ